MSVYIDIISGRRKGPLARITRAALILISYAYRFLIGLRNWYYDNQFGVYSLDRPCISVGNLTTGGTGKTPLVIWLAKWLQARGKKVAILSRGYKGDEHGNDEFQLVSQTCPQAACVAHPNRLEAGRYAIQQHQADIVVCDDAYQHRRLGRDLDIVLIDATCPWGYGHMLPAGLLREPIHEIGRADVIVLSRLPDVTAPVLANLKHTCQSMAPDSIIVGCEHQAQELADLHGAAHSLDLLNHREVGVFCGIANPDSFEKTIRHLGGQPIFFQSFPDHYRYSAHDCEVLANKARQLGIDTLITTEKDLVKLRRLNYSWPHSVWAVRVAIRFVGEGEKMLTQKVQTLFD